MGENGIKRCVNLVMPRRHGALAVLMREARGAMAGFGLSAQAAYAAEMVLEELLANAVAHGQGDDAVELRLRPVAAGDAHQCELELELRDEGPAFDPFAAPVDPEMESLAAAGPGGMGLRLVHGYAKTTQYRREAGTNVLVIRL